MKGTKKTIISKIVELDYDGCCGADGREYYKVIGPDYIINDSGLEFMLERKLEREMRGGCSQCGAELSIADKLSEFKNYDEDVDCISSIIDCTDTIITVDLEKDIRGRYYNIGWDIVESELVAFKESMSIYEDSKVRLELRDLNGVVLSGHLCLYPEFTEDKEIVLKGFVEDIRLPLEDDEEHVYCGDCVHGEALITAMESEFGVNPLICRKCYPFNPEDSARFELRKNYKSKSVEKLSHEDYLKLRNVALELIDEYHKDDVDKGGYPYINHLVRVSTGCKSYESKIAGLLHDIIEDTECTCNILLGRGIPQYVVDVILLVSRKNDESYAEFIDRIVESENKYALELKYSDLRDNCDLSRLSRVSDEEKRKGEKRVLNRYLPALLKIESKLHLK